MPNSKSAKKRLRQNIEHRAENRSVKRTVRTQCGKVGTALAAGEVEQAEAEFKMATKQLDRAGVKNIIHPNATARMKSRLSAKIKAAKQQA